MTQADQVIIEPIITEKAIGERALSRYVFKVNPRSNKISIARAVEQLFKVSVVAVNTSRVRAKRRVSGRFIGKLSQWKRAYVTLKTGQKIKELEA